MGSTAMATGWWAAYPAATLASAACGIAGSLCARAKPVDCDDGGPAAFTGAAEHSGVFATGHEVCRGGEVICVDEAEPALCGVGSSAPIPRPAPTRCTLAATASSMVTARCAVRAPASRSLTATGSRADWTEGGVRARSLARLPETCAITELHLDEVADALDYIDADHAADIFPGEGPVRRWVRTRRLGPPGDSFARQRDRRGGELHLLLHAGLEPSGVAAHPKTS